MTTPEHRQLHSVNLPNANSHAAMTPKTIFKGKLYAGDQRRSLELAGQFPKPSMQID
jgi:hypothetical protein